MSVEIGDTEQILRFSHFTIERAPDGIMWIDSKARIRRVNDALCKRLGYSQEELTFMTIHDIAPDYPKEVWPQHWEEIRKNKVLTFETRVRGKEGTDTPVEIIANFIEFEGKEYACGFARDITERIRAQQELRNAFGEIERLKNRLQAENIYLQEEIKLAHNFDEIISQNDAFRRMLGKIEQVASTNATVLILGETGTGKELVARAVHAISNRKGRPLVKVNCAALPAALIESELFGHEKGAFTGAIARKAGRFELADGGTIFLDEVGDLPLELQAKLLRVLQEGEFERLGSSSPLKVDVRVISATGRNLQKAVESGVFRQDLFYRLNVFPIQLPSLRERKDDIPLLVRHFVKKHSLALNKKIDTIPQRVMDSLVAHSWPGNVRELENMVERAVILTKSPTLSVEELNDPKTVAERGFSSSDTLQDVQRGHILKVLRECNWMIDGPRGAAVRLGLPPSTVRDRMKKFDIKKK